MTDIMHESDFPHQALTCKGCHSGLTLYPAGTDLCAFCAEIRAVESATAPIAGPPAESARRLLNAALYEDGASLWLAETADHGYLVGIPALSPRRSGWDASPLRSVPNGQRDALAYSLIGEWIPTVAELDYVATIGSWLDTATDRVYFDASSHHADLETALTVASNRGELAIWDVANGREIRTDGTVALQDVVAGDSVDPFACPVKSATPIDDGAWFRIASTDGCAYTGRPTDRFKLRSVVESAPQRGPLSRLPL